MCFWLRVLPHASVYFITFSTLIPISVTKCIILLGYKCFICMGTKFFALHASLFITLPFNPIYRRSLAGKLVNHSITERNDIFPDISNNLSFYHFVPPRSTAASSSDCSALTNILKVQVAPLNSCQWGRKYTSCSGNHTPSEVLKIMPE